MPDSIISCPQCSRPLRVPDALVGRLVKCPSCNVQFQAAAGNAVPQPVVLNSPLEAGPSPLPTGPVGQFFAQPAPYPASWAADSARAALTGPAICLILVGILGLLVNTFGLVNTWLIDPAEMAEAQQQMQQRMGLPQQDPQTMELSMRIALGLYMACALGSLIIILGAIQMLRLRSYWLALLGSIVPFFVIMPCCCVVGTPFGIWSLVMLLRPEIRDAFQ